MKSLFLLAAELERFFQERRWRYCFIGGIANQRWGRPRTTVDVDVTLLTGLGTEETYVDELLSNYSARVPDPKAFALKHRVLLLQSSGGIGIDISLGMIAFEEKAVARASRYEFLPGVSLLTCSAEDLIVLKAFADRSQDWLDVEGVLIRQKGFLDWDYIFSELIPLVDLKPAPDILTHLRQLRRELS
jgi:hypothetical protein